MNVFEKAKAAADVIGYTSFPDVAPEGLPESFWKNREDYYIRWITYNMAYEQGTLYGDDKAHAMRSGIQVHLFLPKKENFFSIRKELRNALIEQGFTHPETVLNTIEGDTRHIVMECEDDEESEE